MPLRPGVHLRHQRLLAFVSGGGQSQRIATARASFSAFHFSIHASSRVVHLGHQSLLAYVSGGGQSQRFATALASFAASRYLIPDIGEHSLHICLRRNPCGQPPPQNRHRLGV